MKMKIKTKLLPGGAWRASVPGIDQIFVYHDDDPALAADVAVERKRVTCCTAIGATKERAVALAIACALGDLSFRIKAKQRSLSGGTLSLEQWLTDAAQASLFVVGDEEEG